MKFDKLKLHAGVFEIDRMTIESMPDLVIKLMKNCLIYKAETRDYFNSITYHAFSTKFKPIKSNEQPKKYGIIQHRKILKKNADKYKKGDMVTYELVFDSNSSENGYKIDE